MSEPQTIYFKDYTPSDYTVTDCQLEFIIENSSTRVDNVMKIVRKNPQAKELRLDGEMMELELLWIDDVLLGEDDFRMEEDAIYLPMDTDGAIVRVITRIYPDQNTALEGLYRSGNIWCTQNEPEGFRRITYFIDRPDVMARFTTKIIADRERCPILLGNGNLRGTASLENGKHLALWEDPFPKPSYLFALVAGDLGCVHDTFTTMSGKSVDLNIYCDKGNESKCHHAMRSLKKSMEWDEYTYGREYDLEIYNIVAVDSFNMGAMENKGLNIFNSHYVLADEESATDGDFMGIESVIAHEYFHNWTGNRITCRNWFELTLKEGLTVFRDQCFSADMNSELLQRIDDVKALRERQFVEDSGPTAHPIKPDHYIEINNFYTATVYEKGAEVIRMMHTLLGREKFRKAMDTYFETFDGQAVGTEDFLWAMQTQSPIDLTQFKRWYSQERTPTIKAIGNYEPEQGTYSLTLTQIIPKNTQNHEQLPYAFPMGIALFDASGNPMFPAINGALEVQPQVYWIDQSVQQIVFSNVPSAPKLSINRHFSAPVIIECDALDLPFLMAHDNDGFSRYEAAHLFGIETIEAIVRGEGINEAYLSAYATVLQDVTLDEMFKAQMLEFPTLGTLIQRQETVDVQALFEAQEQLKKTIAAAYEKELFELVETLYEPQNTSIDAKSMGRRALKNRALGLLMSLENPMTSVLCFRHYHESKSMTNRLGTLDMLENYAPELASSAFADFYDRHSDNTLVMNKYFALLASSRRQGTLERVVELQNDPVFDIKVPNLVRALFGSFARNLVAFHERSGKGYRFIAEKVIELDAINPQIASGLAGAFKLYPKLSHDAKALMGVELERIKNHPGISKNVYEIVFKILQS